MLKLHLEIPLERHKTGRSEVAMVRVASRKENLTELASTLSECISEKLGGEKAMLLVPVNPFEWNSVLEKHGLIGQVDKVGGHEVLLVKTVSEFEDVIRNGRAESLVAIAGKVSDSRSIIENVGKTEAKWWKLQSIDQAQPWLKQMKSEQLVLFFDWSHGSAEIFADTATVLRIFDVIRQRLT